MSELFGEIYAHGRVGAEVSREAWLRALLDVEAALAHACEAEGVIPAGAGEAVAAACVPERFDLDELARETGLHASPVVALARLLRERVGPYAHHGATSQDILDTAAMLVTRRALEPLLDDSDLAAGAAAGLARAHRDTPMAGRTLLQRALPTTFGLVAAGWMVGIDEARERLAAVRAQALAVQMGGPVGSRDPAIARRVAELLGLSEPTLTWHTVRVRPAETAGALGVLAGVLAKVARDVTLLAQTEVGEVRENGRKDRGGSSSMPHKRNPVAAVSTLACARRVPGLVATVLAAMEQEHQRAAGAWQAEWGTLTDLLRLTGSAAAWAAELLDSLTIDPERMLANLAGPPTAAELGAATDLVDRALAARGR